MKTLVKVVLTVPAVVLGTAFVVGCVQGVTKALAENRAEEAVFQTERAQLAESLELMLATARARHTAILAAARS